MIGAKIPPSQHNAFNKHDGRTISTKLRFFFVWTQVSDKRKIPLPPSLPPPPSSLPPSVPSSVRPSLLPKLASTVFWRHVLCREWRQSNRSTWCNSVRVWSGEMVNVSRNWSGGSAAARTSEAHSHRKTFDNHITIRLRRVRLHVALELLCCADVFWWVMVNGGARMWFGCWTMSTMIEFILNIKLEVIISQIWYLTDRDNGIFSKLTCDSTNFTVSNKSISMHHHHHTQISLRWSHFTSSRCRR